MPEEKPGEKTRKPGVKYTLDDWKKEADACRKRAEYWRDKFHASEKTANSVADSMTEVLKTHEKLQLDLDHTNKNYLIFGAFHIFSPFSYFSKPQFCKSSRQA